MKKYYFYVTFKVKFIKKWVNPSYDPEEWAKDRLEFTHRDTYEIEQNWIDGTDSVHDSEFFKTLKAKIYNIVKKEFVDNWIESNNKNLEPGCKGWSLDRLEIENISRVG